MASAVRMVSHRDGGASARAARAPLAADSVITTPRNDPIPRAFMRHLLPADVPAEVHGSSMAPGGAARARVAHVRAAPAPLAARSGCGRGRAREAAESLRGGVRSGCWRRAGTARREGIRAAEVRR